MYDVGMITKMSKNYGAVLQAYALKKSMEKCNKSVQIINFNGRIGNQTYDTFLPTKSLSSLKTNVLRLPHAIAIKNSSAKFQQFRQQHFDLSQPVSGTEQLKDNCPNYGYLVVGSDQVWNPNILFDPIYFLDFGSQEAVRFSYAASFGVNEIDSSLSQTIKDYLSKFQSVSVREKTGVQILSKIGIAAQTVLDPTLLLSAEEWRSIEKQPEGIKEPYLLCYCLNYSKELETTLRKIKKLTGLQVISIASNVNLHQLGDRQRWDIGPEEFLWLIDHAKFVFTSSFHGTAFSVIFNKTFCTFNNSVNDSRLHDFLASVGLDYRLKDKVKCESVSDCIAPIEDVAQKKLDSLKRSSKEYLLKQFS